MPVNTPKLTQHKSKYHHYSAVTYRGYVLYWFVLAFILLGLIALPFISVDVSVQSSGVITSLNKMVTISAPLTAKVEQVHITENAKVMDGDTLIVLHDHAIAKELDNCHQQMSIQQSYVDDLKILLSTNEKITLHTPLYQKQLDDNIGAISKIERKIQKLTVDFQRTSGLYNQGVLSLTVFQEDSFLLSEAKDELRSHQTAVEARWETESKNYVLSIHDLENRIVNLKQEQSQYVIVAPLSGSIIDFKGIAAGNFISENEQIAFLSPQEQLVAECYVSPSDIAFIKPGMPVRFQVHAYAYNQWGLLDAQVFEVADDVTLHNGEFLYLIRCRLKTTHLELKNGVQGTMKKGMTLTGRFVITQRTLFQLLFDSVDDWMNPKIQTGEELKNQII